MRSALLTVLCGLALTPLELAAQSVTGIVAVVETAERIQNAEVALLDGEGSLSAVVLTGQNGEFLLEAPSPGAYVVRIRRLGYKPTSAQLVLQTDRMLEVRVNLAPQATELDGITVYGVTADTPEQREFLSRRHLPWNFSLNRREIEQLHVATIGQAIDFGIPVKPLGCKVVFLDGLPARPDLIDRDNSNLPLEWIYGIEVYNTYFDIPLRYRDPGLRQQCGAVFLWRTTPPGYGIGIRTIWSFAAGGGKGWERALFELAWRPGRQNSYQSTARLRIGWYEPEALLGSVVAAQEGVDPDVYPLYASLYFGKQGPVPALPWRRSAYSRVAIGTSIYLNQSSTTVPSGDSVIVVDPSTSAHFGVGAELALGLRYPTGTLRPWLEVRTGSEWIMHVGVRWARPVFLIGLEFGGGT